MSDVSMSEKAKNLKLGRYEHYKGKICEVVGVALHSETIEEMVVYKETEQGLMWVRPLEMFVEEVEVKGMKRPRFKYMGS